MEKLDQLITKAQQIYDEPYRSPKYDLWRHDSHQYIESTFGHDLVKIFDDTLDISVFRMGDDMRLKRNERVQKAVEFIEELKGRDADSDLSSSTTQTIQEAKDAVHARFNRTNITVTGNATFGDSSPLNQIQITEFLTALAEEAEKLPDTPEKNSLLHNLKVLLENPTLASVAGGFVGGVMQGLVR